MSFERANYEEAMLSCLGEIRFWLRLLGREKLAEQLASVLSGDRDRRIYQLSDGAKSSTVIAKEVGVSQPTIVNLWSKWRRAGLVRESPETKGRCVHVVNLDDLGL